jgi:CBS domain-containing protein
MASVGVAPDEIDLKRSGIFPAVHGVRALCIEKGILATSTAARIASLVEARTFEPAFGDELVGALHVFMEFRLKSQLRAIRSGKRDKEAVLHFREITPAERDILRDALRVVREFREFIRVHYNLAAF